MTTKLTERVVEALKPEMRPYERRDSGQTGLLCRVQPTGVKTFWYVYSFAGKRGIRFRLGRFPGLSVEGAQKLAKIAAGRVAEGVNPQALRKSERALTGVARVNQLDAFLDERFEPWAKTTMKSATEQLKRIRSDFADYLTKPIAALDLPAIEKLRQKWKQGGKQHRTINRDIQRIQSVLSRAVEWGILDQHPLKALKPMKFDEAGRVRFLSAAEESALRTALDTRQERMRSERARFNEWRVTRHLAPLPNLDAEMLDHLKPMVLLALNTGMRRGELFSLKWADVDLSERILTVQAASAKSGQTRRIPLNPEAVTVLKAWEGASSKHDLVFPGAEGKRLTNINKSWSGVVKLAGITGFNFHDLRHTFASRLVQRSVDLNTVRTLLGHSEISMTLIYAHLADDHLRAAVERMAG
jgi:integrase